MREAKTGHIWIGFAKDEARFFDFFEETYSEDLDIPLNDFIASQNGTWYDHDWVERIFHHNDPKLVNFFTYMKSAYISGDEKQRLEKEIEGLKMPDLNATVVFFEGANVQKPQHVEADNLSLRYVGKFTYRM